MKYLVFVDIDGVLTSNRAEFSDGLKGRLWSKFDPIAIDFFNRIHDTFHEVEFVMISTWRNYIKYDDSMMRLWMETSFRNSGFRGEFSYPYWKVNPLEDRELYQKERAYEIKHYLKEYAQECKDYIIFDDSDFKFEEVLGKKRLVKTDCDNGMLFKHMRNAWSIMGMWDRKSEYDRT
ncbi:MAG: hypothetical protein COA84_13650 [Robiginitomaculum sp.]|nr:MAG: hypothetical protein COA84_13650 [Robiginitomaculum sp.]